MGTKRPLRVAALLSGGVDSTVAAAILREQGHEVLGVHLLLGCSSGEGCGGKDSLEAACRAAAEVGIPLIVIDLRRPFERLVVKPFLRGRVIGRTRNPCVTCNARLRFGVVWDHLRVHGIEALASGHFARLVPAGGPVLARASHASVDQSYVLFAVPRERLVSCRFPLGDLSKEDVRQEALRRGYSAATRPSSQDLCFATGTSVVDIIEREPTLSRRVRPGDIVDRDGRVVGTHDGVHHFTIGQRKGLGPLGPVRRYVAEIHVRSRRIVAGSEKDARRTRFAVARVSFHAAREASKQSFRARLATRYQTKLVEAVVVPLPHRRAWVYVEPPGAVASPGQCAVWYEGDFVVGGGEIV